VYELISLVIVDLLVSRLSILLAMERIAWRNGLLLRLLFMWDLNHSWYVWRLSLVLALACNRCYSLLRRMLLFFDFLCFIKELIRHSVSLLLGLESIFARWVWIGIRHVSGLVLVLYVALCFETLMIALSVLRSFTLASIHLLTFFLSHRSFGLGLRQIILGFNNIIITFFIIAVRLLYNRIYGIVMLWLLLVLVALASMIAVRSHPITTINTLLFVRKSIKRLSWLLRRRRLCLIFVRLFGCHAVLACLLLFWRRFITTASLLGLRWWLISLWVSWVSLLFNFGSFSCKLISG